jgi:hypothetical protein
MRHADILTIICICTMRRPRLVVGGVNLHSLDETLAAFPSRSSSLLECTRFSAFCQPFKTRWLLHVAPALTYTTLHSFHTVYLQYVFRMVLKVDSGCFTALSGWSLYLRRNVFPVRYEVNICLLCRRNHVFKAALFVVDINMGTWPSSLR